MGGKVEQPAVRKKVGLALGGGAARGLAHIGVLEVLEREGVPVDMIAGTSIGAIVGAVYACTRDIQLMKTLAKEVGVGRVRYIFSDVTFPRTGLIRLDRVEKLLKQVIGCTRFEDLKVPLSCAAVDIDRGEEVILDRGPVWDAARASACVPAIVSLKMVEGRNLVDGGLLNPVPASIARRMGADFVIAVNVIPAKPFESKGKLGLFALMMKTVTIVEHSLLATGLAEADVVIEPDVKDIDFVDFHRAEECILLGQQAAERALPEIKRRLGLNVAAVESVRPVGREA